MSARLKRESRGEAWFPAICLVLVIVGLIEAVGLRLWLGVGLWAAGALAALVVAAGAVTLLADRWSKA